MDHLSISCQGCRAQLRSTTFYEPPHDIRHRQAGSVAGGIRPVATATTVGSLGR